MFLTKFLSRGGVCSRREATKLIEQGMVHVDGHVAKDNQFVENGQQVLYRGNAVVMARPRVWIYHKTMGELVTTKDPGFRRIGNRMEKGPSRQTSFDTIKALKPDLPRLMSVGRLDYHSEGLLLMTNAGEVVSFLENPANRIQRVYRVKAHGDVTNAQLDIIRRGAMIEGTLFRPAKIEMEDPGTLFNNRWYRVTLQEGKNREIHRLFNSVGASVSRIKRLEYGPYALGTTKPGKMREVGFDRRLERKLENWRLKEELKEIEDKTRSVETMKLHEEIERMAAA